MPPTKAPKAHFILMADIIGSSALSLEEYDVFKQAIDKTNRNFARKLLSPLTITLGDEFQGVIKNRKSGIEIIIDLEEEMLLSGIQMRYSFGQGTIDTAINPENAHGMVGPGLTKTRKALEEVKESEDRHTFDFKDRQLTKKLTLAFRVYRSLVDDWFIRTGDAALAHDFLHLKDYKVIAEKYHKDNSSMWRKGKSLKISEYLALKELILILSGAK